MCELAIPRSRVASSTYTQQICQILCQLAKPYKVFIWFSASLPGAMLSCLGHQASPPMGLNDLSSRMLVPAVVECAPIPFDVLLFHQIECGSATAQNVQRSCTDAVYEDFVTEQNRCSSGCSNTSTKFLLHICWNLHGSANSTRQN